MNKNYSTTPSKCIKKEPHFNSHGKNSKMNLDINGGNIENKNYFPKGCEVASLISPSRVIFALNMRYCPMPAYETTHPIWWLKPKSHQQNFNSQHIQILLACGAINPYESMIKNAIKQFNQIVQPLMKL
jgi:hypothetical protein